MGSRRLLGAAVGVLSAAVAVGVGELGAAFVRPEAAPVIAVGNRVITLTPESAKRSAIDTFGVDDKTVLLAGIYVLLFLFAAVVGQLALSRLRYGLIGIGVFALAGTYCALTANGAKGGDVVPTLLAAAAAAGVLAGLVRTIQREDVESKAVDLRLTRRRGFLEGSAAAVGLAALSWFGGRAALRSRFDVADDRKKVALPRPVSAAMPPSGTDLGKSGVPWLTPASDFYRIDTALSVPQLRTRDWTLRVHGMVQRELTLTYDELLRRPMIERWITLCCVSNEVGGHLIGNARWLGARLADLLREAGVDPAADQLLLTSSDGYTFGAPAKVVMDGRDALLAVGMNGQPLPVEHGFPVRVVVPGLYGYVSACKWVVDIEATTFSDAKAYWVQGGWASGQQQPEIKLESRIDTPRTGARVKVGTPAVIAGVAWDQHVGVSAVDVQVGDGPWLPARLASVPSTDTWRQWVVAWTPSEPGDHTVRVRATDAAGNAQTDRRADPFPSGATGLHTITVHADA